MAQKEKKEIVLQDLDDLFEKDNSNNEDLDNGDYYSYILLNNNKTLPEVVVLFLIEVFNIDISESERIMFEAHNTGESLIIEGVTSKEALKYDENLEDVRDFIFEACDDDDKFEELLEKLDELGIYSQGVSSFFVSNFLYESVDDLNIEKRKES
tara:strand:- start:3070 stop:3531 length:462 start_codon:yes stop_codon:yes gene_type:complete